MVRYLYNFGFYLALPFVMLRLLIKAKRLPAYKRRWHERLAHYTDKPLPQSIWVHAVSLGEAVAVTPLIEKLLKTYPHLPVIATTMTPTGSQQLEKKFGSRIHHFYVPYDYSGAVKRFLNHFNPKLVIIMETELWPNILYYSAKRKIPILLANARLTEKSVRGYKKLGSLTKQMLSQINLIAAQSQVDVDRFLAIGANPKKVELFGNIKFDCELNPEISLKAKNLRQKIGNERLVWIAASTHEGEEKIVLSVFKKIKAKQPKALLILVPRHPERFATVKNLVKQSGLSFSCRSEKTNITPNIDIILGDTLGELLILYGAADVAFVGGSLVPVGGHNLLEPALFGLPIVTGPELESVKEISEMLLNNKILFVVKSENELLAEVLALLTNAELRAAIADRCSRVMNNCKGVIAKLMLWIKQKI